MQLTELAYFLLECLMLVGDYFRVRNAQHAVSRLRQPECLLSLTDITGEGILDKDMLICLQRG